MRLLISGYCPHGNTGYGIQTDYLLDTFAKDHEVFLIFWDIVELENRSMMSYKEFSKLRFNKSVVHDVKLYMPSKPLSDFTNNFWKDMDWAVKSCLPDRIITIHDIWTIPTEIKPFDTPMHGWIPIHYDPPEVQTIVNLRNYETVWSLSLWGKGILKEYHHDVRYVPHFIDDVFFDGVFANTERKNIIRKKLGIVDHAYVVLMVARNTEKSNRKGFNVALQAFAAYKRTKNPLAHLHMHVNINGAVDIKQIVEELNLGDCVTCTDQEKLSNYKVSKEYVRDLYIASDVLLSTSAAEGFGLPNIEAQCCGLPVIATNTTAITESVIMGRLHEPAHTLSGNPGSFSQPHPTHVFNELVHIDRNPFSTVEKNNARNTLWARFNKHAVKVMMNDAMVFTDGKTKMCFLPHELHTYDLQHKFYSYNGRDMYCQEDHKMYVLDENYDVKESEASPHDVRFMCRDYYINNEQKLFKRVNDGDDEYVCDVQDTDQLCNYDNQVCIYNQSSGIRLLNSSKTISCFDAMHCTHFDETILSTHCHDNKMLIHLNNGVAMIHNIDDNVSQKIIINDISVRCFVVLDDKVLVFGSMKEQNIVKVLMYKSLKINE